MAHFGNDCIEVSWQVVGCERWPAGIVMLNSWSSSLDQLQAGRHLFKIYTT